MKELEGSYPQASEFYERVHEKQPTIDRLNRLARYSVRNREKRPPIGTPTPLSCYLMESFPDSKIHLCISGYPHADGGKEPQKDNTMCNSISCKSWQEREELPQVGGYVNKDRT